MLKLASFAALLALTSAPGWGQASNPQATLPYAGQQNREVKALSDQEIADLRAGKGSGLALAAELNGYAGPSHVLELADRLDLTDSQKTAILVLFRSMKLEATAIGERLIAQEADLDHQFASRSMTTSMLLGRTQQIGATQAELRNAHLKYHLLTADILSPGQARTYAELRGYNASAAPHSHGHKP